MDQPPEQPSLDDDHDAALLGDELREAVRQAFGALSARCQQLLRLLSLDPPMSYRDVSDHLAMPIGSIGATRQRCLASLRTRPSMQMYLGGAV